ncbi:sporulation integral membrane protein YlbJ [Litchfieldia salsa]|uniref:Sporulation integral membrane protein YlbJ n=1 Tax=Litchfieldia salsa TaxID=930152 RepID=A0A1H0RGR6_9BACI|nr:sporulation integral membrane protein YlbJ [Litchfieldia salsa]SDP28379.1 sporulation integral membrane protein YlbJ [Litchfieldia salsa]
MLHSKIKTLFLASGALFLAISLISFPKESLDASIRGLNMWWEVVFPSLLPFFIVSELLIGFGIVKFIGVLLEPLMRPLFRVPGVGGFVWVMGLASGFPAGAKFTARLRQEKQLTSYEAERLVSFTNASNPLFIFGAIAVGFFHNPHVGVILAVAHYIGNLCVGLIMRFYGPNEKGSARDGRKGSQIREAFRALHYTRLEEKRPFGKMLGDAVTSSIQTLLMVGGFIILFSVFNALLALVNFTDILALMFSYALKLFTLPVELATPLIAGLFEITLGSQMASNTAEASLFYQIIITSFILGFCGLSVQAQVASILAETDIRFKPFFFARILHGFIAAFLTIIFWKPLYINLQDPANASHAVTVFFHNQTTNWVIPFWEKISQFGPIITIASLGIYLCIYVLRMRSVLQ